MSINISLKNYNFIQQMLLQLREEKLQTNIERQGTVCLTKPSVFDTETQGLGVLDHDAKARQGLRSA